MLAAAVSYICTSFGVDSSSRFPVTAQTDTPTRKVTDAADRPDSDDDSTAASAGNNRSRDKLTVTGSGSGPKPAVYPY